MQCFLSGLGVFSGPVELVAGVAVNVRGKGKGLEEKGVERDESACLLPRVHVSSLLLFALKLILIWSCLQTYTVPAMQPCR